MHYQRLIRTNTHYMTHENSSNTSDGDASGKHATRESEDRAAEERAEANASDLPDQETNPDTMKKA
jgi:hypothetical protein